MKKYNKTLKAVIDQIVLFLEQANITFKKIKNSFKINTEDIKCEDCKKKVDEIIIHYFGDKDVTRVRKYNYHENKLYIQFKKSVTV